MSNYRSPGSTLVRSAARRRGLACAAALLVALAAPAGGGDAVAVLAFLDVRVFDGREVHPSTRVVVRDDRVAAIGVREVVPPGATVVAGAGRTLLPGLIDAHTHVASPTDLRQALAFGVTTELEMAGAPEQAARLRRRERKGLAPNLADLRSAGHPVTAPGGHGTEYGRASPTVAGPEEVARFVDARAAEGSDYLKIMLDDGTPGYVEWPVISRPTLRAAVAAAHRHDLLAVVHITSEEDALAAARAGADGLVHLPFAGVEGAELPRLLRERDVFVTTTLSVFHAICDPSRGDALADDPRIARRLDAEAEARLRHGHAIRGAPRLGCEHGFEALRALHAAGVTVLAGTDAGNPGTAHGASLHDELALLVEAGMTPLEALRAATSLPAERFGLADRGLIEVGRRADLLLVEGDPTRDVTATRAIAGVWKAGRRLRPELPGSAPKEAAR